MRYFHETVIALALIASAGSAQAAGSASSLTAGALVSSVVDVTEPPPSPLLRLDIAGTAGAVIFVWQGPSGQMFRQGFSGGPWQGKTLFQGQVSNSIGVYFGPQSAAPYQSVFGLYTQPGRWRLTEVDVCGAGTAAESCSEATGTAYVGSALSALFGRLTMTIVNPNPYDLTPPAVASGVLLSRTVSLSGDRTLHVSLAVSDDLSGVGNVAVCATAPTSGGLLQLVCGYANGFSSVVRKAHVDVPLVFPAGSATGTWTIGTVGVVDIAGNSFSAGADSVGALFGGKTSFTVTQ